MNIYGNKYLQDAVYGYARRLDLNTVGNIVDGGFFIAGGALQKETPNDFDLFSCEPDGKGFDFDAIRRRCVDYGYGYVVADTGNALTVMVNGQKVQFCKYRKDFITDLLKSFDFAHTQVACEIGKFRNATGEGYHYDPCEVYCTNDYILSKIADCTFYTGSEYPLSSLMRVGKFYKQGKYNSNSKYKIDVVKIMLDVVSRGIANKADLIDQMASVSEAIDMNEAVEKLMSCLQNPYSISEEKKEEDIDEKPF